MEWKKILFWKKDGKTQTLPKPTEIPDEVGRYLVVRLRKDPDWVWNLKAVLRPRAETPHVYDVRVYSDAAVRSMGLAVRDYHSLDAHPEAVLFEGWGDRKKSIAEVRPVNDVTRAA